MAQRKSGYERKERDLYETPEWVTDALIPHIPERVKSSIWEPACASGRMSHRLNAAYSSDIVTYYTRGVTDVDFLKESAMRADCTAIVTNPPFNKEAEKFIRHGIKLLTESSNLNVRRVRIHGVDTEVSKTMYREEDGVYVPDYRVPGFMAMLLPVDFDSGKTRRDMFADCPFFAGKVVLTKRIVWFEKDGGANPSANHCWLLWDWNKSADTPPFLKYHFAA